VQFLDWLGFFDKGINISHDREELVDIVIPVFLVFDDLYVISAPMSRILQTCRETVNVLCT
jgi:hypothetical protein